MQSLCVFCGSSVGNDPRYPHAAEELGTLLAARGVTLVYGGGQVGLMGVLADAVLAGGGRVVGVIPQRLATKELLHPGATEMHVVASMHERKARMAELADAFVALPGGYGTFEELFEVVTWAQLGIHRKSTGLLNVAGYFDPLVALIDNAVACKFIKPQQRELVVVEAHPGPLLEHLARHRLPVLRKWIDPDES